MSTWITIDKDNQAFSEESDKYKQGFEKNADGTFTKKLDDPRCISAKKMKKALIEQNEYLNKEVFKEDKDIPGLRVFTVNKKYDVLELLKERMSADLKLNHKDYIVYERATFMSKSVLDKVGTTTWYPKIQFCLKSKHIYIWSKVGQTDPDIILKDILE